LIRSKKLLRAAKDKTCVNCGVGDDTVVAAHYQGFRSQSFGKGKSIKVHDICCADLCYRCHSAFDRNDPSLSHLENSWSKKIDISEQFLFCVVQTIIRRVGDGTIKIEGYDPDGIPNRKK
jgi:hypothetical protein|tara:strand:- start:1092 stop:1451 length:360 start_codon:yes stop_codon:yes gene_type:complete